MNEAHSVKGDSFNDGRGNDDIQEGIHGFKSRPKQDGVDEYVQKIPGCGDDRERKDMDKHFIAGGSGTDASLTKAKGHT